MSGGGGGGGGAQWRRCWAVLDSQLPVAVECCWLTAHPSSLPAAPEPAPVPVPAPAAPAAAAPAAAAPAAAAPAAPALAPVEAATKEVKKMAVSGSGDDDVLLETPAQREARVADVKKTLEELNADDPRWPVGVGPR